MGGLVHVDSNQQRTNATPAESDHSITKAIATAGAYARTKILYVPNIYFFPFASIVCGDLEMHKRGGNVGGK